MSEFPGRQESASSVTAPNDKLHSLLNPLACPRCGTRMRLARIVPLPTPVKTDEITYDCSCGHSETETVPSP